MLKYILLPAFWLGTSALFAQNNNSRLIDLDTLVVSATKFEQLKKTQPFQIQYISKTQISFQNAINTADLLMNTGNVFVQKSQGGGGSPVLRGFEASRLLIVVDGIRMNNAIYRAGHLQNVLRIDQSMLESAEVLFGPSSVIYGSDALGGVMHFRSKNPVLAESPKWKMTANAYGRYSSAISEKTGHFDFSFSNNKIGFLASLTASDFGDVVQGSARQSLYPDFGKLKQYVVRENGADVVKDNPNPNKQIGSAYKQIDFLQKVLFRHSAKAQSVVNIQYSNTSDVPRYDRLTENTANRPRFAEWYYGPEKRWLAAYHLNLNSGLVYDKAQITVAYQTIEESRHSRRLGVAARKSQIENVKLLTFNADFQKNISKNLIQYGIEVALNDVKSTAFNTVLATGAVTPADTRYPGGMNKMNSFAAYLTNQFLLSEQLTLNLGTRYTKVNLEAEFTDKTFFPFPFSTAKQNSGALSGNLGLIWKPIAATKISILGATGFRTPNIDDLTKVFESRVGILIVPNPDLKPEKTVNTEISINQKIGANFAFEATYFYTLYTNALVLSPFTLNGQTSTLYNGQMSTILATQNKREAYLTGWNLGAKWQFAPQFLFSSTLNFTSGRIKDEKNTPLDHIPPVFGRAGLNYTSKKCQVDLFTIYNGTKRIADYNPDGEDNAQYATLNGMPSWWTLNARTSFRLITSLTFQVACENILDQNYRHFASGISSPGRNFVATLRAKI